MFWVKLSPWSDIKLTTSDLLFSIKHFIFVMFDGGKLYVQIGLVRLPLIGVGISSSCCLKSITKPLVPSYATIWDISIYSPSLMPYIEIMLNVVQTFGKLTCVWPLFHGGIKCGMNPEIVQRIETMVWVVAKCGFRTWTCFALLPTMTLRRNDTFWVFFFFPTHFFSHTFWVALSNSICVLLMMT